MNGDMKRRRGVIDVKSPRITYTMIAAIFSFETAPICTKYTPPCNKKRYAPPFSLPELFHPSIFDAQRSITGTWGVAHPLLWPRSSRQCTASPHPSIRTQVPLLSSSSASPSFFFKCGNLIAKTRILTITNTATAKKNTMRRLRLYASITGWCVSLGGCVR
jgi:hypothetical protein